MVRVDVPTEILSHCNAGKKVTLPQEQSHYISDVLRLGPGDCIELFDGQGIVARATLIGTEKKVQVTIDDVAETERGESPLRIVLFQAIPKGKRWAWILEKATELGVDKVIPLETGRTVVQIPNSRLERRMKRWNKIVAGAARQCERTIVPEVTAPMSVDGAFDHGNSEAHFVAHPSPSASPPGRAFGALDDDVSSVGIWIGPEGGFSDSEHDRLTARGVASLSLGPRILRADTAGIVALTLLQAARGDI